MALSMVCWLSPSAALAQDNPNTEGAPVRSMPATSPVVAPETIPSNPEKAAKPAPPIKKLNGKKAAKAPPKAKTKNVVSPAPALQTPKELGGVVGAIQVKGNKKIENDAVLARLVSHVSDPFSSDKVRKDVEALFKTGYFYDIQVDRSVGSDGKINLVYNLIEKPSITEIVYRGNSEVESDDLKEATGIKTYEILNMSKIHDAQEKLQKLYEDKGYFLARVTPKVETLKEGESVRLVFEISESDKVKVKRVTFLGNKNLTDGKLKAVMQTQEGGFFSFISDKGAYKQDAFDHDLQILNYLYFNEGYVDVKLDRPQVYVTPDRKSIYITIRVEEGERYKVGTVDFAGDLLFDRDELFATAKINGSGWYKHETLLSDIRSLQAKYGDLGYAYANIIPRTRKREKDREVDITFEIDKGDKVYFGKINVVGNTKTRDKVVRRELLIHEGELYNETRKRESIEAVKRLGFFEDVAFNSKTPADSPDLMDLDISVKERNTGTIQLGAGYSTFSKFNLTGQINQTNLFGRGQKLGLSVDFSSLQSLFNVNFTEPYLYDTLWSAGVDGYRQQRLIPNAYADNEVGGAVRFGHPLAPFLTGFIRYKFDHTEIAPVYADPDLYPVPNAADPNPSNNPNGYTSSATFTLEYDKRDDRFAPANGFYSTNSIEYAGVGGDKHYTKGYFSQRYYKKTFWDVIWRNNLTYGFIRSNQPGEAPPYNQLYLLGGANTLRGYDWYSVGRRKHSSLRQGCLGYGADADPANPTHPECGALPRGLSSQDAKNQSDVPFGGQQELIYQTEFEFPLISEAGVKGVVFYDIGYADDVLELAGLRMDWGFGFRWFSPIGPLRFEWGFPIARRTDLGEAAVNFQFAIGSPF